jgi:hypothetical protein
MNFDLPSPTIDSVMLFQTSEMFLPGKTGPKESPIPGMKVLDPLDPSIDPSEFFNKQLEVNCSVQQQQKGITFLSDEVQSLKFISLTLDKVKEQNIIGVNPVSTVVETEVIRLFSLKEIYNGLHKTAVTRFALPSPKGIKSFKISLYFKVNYDLLKNALNLVSGNVLQVLEEVRDTITIIENGILLIEDAGAVESLDSGEGNIGDVIQPVQMAIDEQISDNNKKEYNTFITKPQIIKTDLDRFSIVCFFDKYAILTQKSDYKRFYMMMNQQEQASVKQASTLESITLDLVDGKNDLKMVFPKPSGLNTNIEANKYSYETYPIKTAEIAIFNIPAARLDQKYRLDYHLEVKDGIRQFLVDRGMMIREDMAKLKDLLGQYTVAAASNNSIPRHQDVMPMSPTFVESYSNNLFQGNVQTVNSLDLNVQNLTRLINILYSTQPTTGLTAASLYAGTANAPIIPPSSDVFGFIETVRTKMTPSAEKDVRALLSLYEKVEQTLLSSGIKLDKGYTEATSTEGATLTSPMSHVATNDTITCSAKGKELVSFNKDNRGYLFLKESNSFLRYKKSNFGQDARLESRKYLTDASIDNIADNNILSPTEKNGQVTMPLLNNVFSYFTPKKYVAADGAKFSNSFTTEEEYYNKDANIKRLLRAIIDDKDTATFLKFLEGINILSAVSVDIQQAQFGSLASGPGNKVTSDMEISEKIVDTDDLSQELQGYSSTPDRYVNLITSKMLAKYIPDPSFIAQRMQFLFSLLPYTSDPETLTAQYLRDYAPNQSLLLLAGKDGYGLGLENFRFIPNTDSNLVPFDINLDGMQDERNFAFFFNNLINLFKVEKLTSFAGGFVSSPVWKTLTPEDLESSEDLLCRLVPPQDVHKNARLPIYNEMFLLSNIDGVGGLSAFSQFSLAPSQLEGGAGGFSLTDVGGSSPAGGNY